MSFLSFLKPLFHAHSAPAQDSANLLARQISRRFGCRAAIYHCGESKYIATLKGHSMYSVSAGGSRNLIQAEGTSKVDALEAFLGKCHDSLSLVLIEDTSGEEKILARYSWDFSSGPG